LIDDLNICEDERYLATTEVAALKQQAWRVHKLLNGYLRYLRERKQGANLALHESSPAYGLIDDALDDLIGQDNGYASTL
jgi:hypothetical protein